jgi:hypothetical protein
MLGLCLYPAIAQEGPDEIESNDKMDLADSIDGFEIEGTIGPDDTDDWYVLEGQGGYYPEITLDFDDDDVEIDWEVYSDDEVVWSSYDYGAPESMREVAVRGTCYIHLWHWSGQGDYTIEITPTDVANDECAGDDEIEPNDDMDLADTISDFKIYGYMCEDDEDWFVLEGQEGRYPTFTLDFDEDEVEIDWEIYSDEDLVDDSVDYGAPEKLRPEVPGVCYIHLWQWSGEGEYTIEIDTEE